MFLHIPATNSCCASIPRFYACSVRKFDGTDGKKARACTRIGVAFPHKDGTGFTIEVHSFPLDGRIVLFPTDSEARTEENASLSLLRCEPAGTSMYRRSLGEETCCPV